MRNLIIVIFLLLAIFGAFGDNGNDNGNGNGNGNRNGKDDGKNNGNGKGNGNDNDNNNGNDNDNDNNNGNGNDNGNDHGNGNGNGMSVGYYSKKCHQADVEDIVQKIVWQTVTEKPAMAPKLLRLQFHDCFVRGCEGSVLLDSPTNSSEKAAIPNLSLGGFEVIDTIKTSLEQLCPGIVSCADIVALAARDAVSFQFNKRMWEVYTGREDGIVSVKSEALDQLPSPFAKFSTLLTNFQNKTLDLVDLVALSGGHTIGISHCRLIANRLYNFSGKGDTDPDMDPDYAQFLKTKICPLPLNPNTILEMDPNSNTTFNSDYFRAVSQRKGLFTSDAELLKDLESVRLVQLYEDDQTAFLTQFGKSMVNMGNIGVLTNGQGQIRLKCNVVN